MSENTGVDRAGVLQVLLDLLGEPELTEDNVFAGRGVDSLALVEYVMDVEDALGVELTESEVAGAPTLGGLADVIVAKRS